MTQPADRRLITEAAGNATYGTKAEVAAKMEQSTADQRYALKGEVPSAGVSSLQVANIVAVPAHEPLPDLADGDMVVRYLMPGANYFTDFSEYEIDQEPSDFTRMWAASGRFDVTVVSDPAATGGKVLRVDVAPAVRALVWNAIDSDPDRANAEVLVRWRSSIGFILGGAIRVAGGLGQAAGYRGGSYGPGDTPLRISRYVDGAHTSLADDTRDEAVVANSWYFTRFRAHQDQMMMKVWADTDPEPTGWDLTATDDVVPGPGSVGVGIGGDTVTDIDYIAVGTGGRRAVLQ